MRFLSSFNESLFFAVDYYAGHDPELARRFIVAVDCAKDQISRFPKIGRVSGTYRVYPLAGFPFTLCYEQDLNGQPVGLVLHHDKARAFTKS